MSIDQLTWDDLPRPEPMPSLEAYNNERIQRLKLYPKCKENFDKYEKSSRRNKKLDYLPLKLDIENVSRCNFRCVMCQVSEWPGGKRAEDLALHKFIEIVDQNPGLLEIKLQGMGEPTMGRDEYFEMIRYARNLHIWVRTVTNGSLLHQNDNIEKFLSSGVNEIQISIDGSTKDVFEKIRKGGKFEKVKGNVSNLNFEASRRGKKITKMWTVVQQSNIEQLESLVDLATELQFPSMVFSLDVIDWGNMAWTARNSAIKADSSLTLERAFRLVDLGSERGIRVAFWNINQKYETKDLSSLCPWPFERAYIGSDERVVPCCMIADPDTYEIGQAGAGSQKQTFVQIWNSVEYEKFREAHLTGQVPNVCRSCYR
jgi:MoaA/NifB/PqqE/SkfB family radical SAM enzyme